MAITVQDLLIGPRGRRPLLELALRCEPSDTLRRALFGTLTSTDDARRVRYTRPLADPSARERGSGGDAAPSAASFAELLARTPLATPTAEDLLLALAESVEHAMSWEPPDSEDVLAAHPAMHTALIHVAEHALPHLPPWWEQPVTADDHPVVITFEMDRAPAPPAPPRTIAQILRADRRDAVERSGTWWSTPPDALPATSRTTSDGTIPGLSLVEDGHGWTAARCTSAQAAPGADPFEIDGPEAWIELCRRFPLDVHAARHRLWDAATGTRARWVQPDWEAAAAEIDGIHVTVRGYLTSAGRALDLGGGRASVMAGWTPDGIVWFRAVTTDEARSRRWVTGPDDLGPWRPA